MADHRPVLLGMNNPVSSDPEHALYPHPPGCTGHRLWVMSGLEKGDYLRLFDRRNVLSGRAWSMAAARAEQEGLRRDLLGRHVVLLGAPVNSIMRGGTEHELAPPFRWTPDGAGGWMARVPHPSGLCRFWNDPLHAECGRVFMEELASLSSAAPTG